MLPRRLKQLEADLESANETACQSAIEELAGSDHEYALDLLLARSKSRADSLAQLAADCFVDSARKRPSVALRHSSHAIRHEAARVLGETGCDAAVDELIRLARNDSDATLRQACAVALGKIATPEARGGLEHAVRDPDGAVRHAGFEGLRKSATTAAEQAIASLLDDECWELRQAVKDHLEATGWIPQSARERVLWAIALGRFDEALAYGPESVVGLISAATRVDDSDARHWAAIALGRLRGYGVADRLTEMTRSSNTRVREAAKEALQKLGPIDRTARPQQVAETPPKPAPRRTELSPFHAALRMLALVGEP